MTELHQYRNTSANDSITCEEFEKELDQFFHFTHIHKNHQEPLNMLYEKWGQRNFVNAPFGKLEPFLEKGLIEARENNAMSCFLLPVRTQTIYFFKYVFTNKFARSIWFLRRGIRFDGYERVSPTPLCLVIMQGHTDTTIYKPPANNTFIYDIPLHRQSSQHQLLTPTDVLSEEEKEPSQPSPKPTPKRQKRKKKE